MIDTTVFTKTIVIYYAKQMKARYKFMAKAAITKKISVTADGVLNLDDNSIKLETSSGQIDLCTLLADFDGQPIKFSVNYSEEYE